MVESIDISNNVINQKPSKSESILSPKRSSINSFVTYIQLPENIKSIKYPGHEYESLDFLNHKGQGMYLARLQTIPEKEGAKPVLKKMVVLELIEKD